MGMYDVVKCEMPLPGKNPCPRNDDFQTKDFDNYFTHYTIRADGALENEDGPVNYSGEVRFYDADWDSSGGKHGAWWEYQAKFINGKCVELTCVSDGVKE